MENHNTLWEMNWKKAAMHIHEINLRVRERGQQKWRGSERGQRGKERRFGISRRVSVRERFFFYKGWWWINGKEMNDYRGRVRGTRARLVLFSSGILHRMRMECVRRAAGAGYQLYRENMYVGMLKMVCSPDTSFYTPWHNFTLSKGIGCFCSRPLLDPT